jgi:hypothetical protein
MFLFAAISLLLYCTASYLYRAVPLAILIGHYFLTEIVKSLLDRFINNPCKLRCRNLHHWLTWNVSYSYYYYFISWLGLNANVNYMPITRRTRSTRFKSVIRFLYMMQTSLVFYLITHRYSLCTQTVCRVALYLPICWITTSGLRSTLTELHVRSILYNYTQFVYCFWTDAFDAISAK